MAPGEAAPPPSSSEVRIGRNRPGRPTFTVLVLSVANLWSSGTTFLVFAVFARSLDRASLGGFAFVTGVSAATVSLMDLGQGIRLVRDAIGHSSPDGVLARELQRRIKMAVVAPAAPCVLCLAVGVGESVAALAFLLTAGASLYGFFLVIERARDAFKPLVVIQGANGVLFVMVLCVVWLTLPRASLASAVLVPALSMTLLCAGLLFRHRRLVTLRTEAGPPLSTDARYFGAAAVANTITLWADNVVLGLISKPTLATYSASQRPVLGVNSAAIALGYVVLPRLARANVEGRRRALRQANAAAVTGLACAAMSVPVAAWLLPEVYGQEELADPRAFGLLLGAAILDALCHIPSSVLLLAHRARVVTRLSFVQATILILGLVVAGVMDSTLIAAGTVFVGRGTVLASQQRSALNVVASAADAEPFETRARRRLGQP